MTFRATIKPGHGQIPREIEFDLQYDATSVLEAHIEREYLRHGETIVKIERIA